MMEVEQAAEPRSASNATRRIDDRRAETSATDAKTADMPTIISSIERARRVVARQRGKSV
jgi:hypothetical protein